MKGSKVSEKIDPKDRSLRRGPRAAAIAAVLGGAWVANGGAWMAKRIFNFLSTETKLCDIK